MASLSYKARKFQIYFLKFLAENPNREVHVYNEVMNFWGNDSTDISLTEMKDAITDLCNRDLIISKNNFHNSIGVHGIPEEEQKNNALCIIQDAGKEFVKRADLKKKIRIIILAAFIIVLLYLFWRYLKLSDLLR